MLDPHDLLDLRDASQSQLSLQHQHRDAVELGRGRPDYEAVAPEPNICDGALGDPSGLVDQQALVEASGGREGMKSALSPAPDMLEPSERPLEMLSRHGVRAVQHLLRTADRDDHASPVTVDPDARIRSAVERVTDVRPDDVSVQRSSVNLPVRGGQPGEMQVEAPGSAVTHLHRGEVAPALMIKQGNRLVAGLTAVDLYVSRVLWHGHIVPATDRCPDRWSSGFRYRPASAASGRSSAGTETLNSVDLEA